MSAADASHALSPAASLEDDRYRVTSITGYPITEASMRANFRGNRGPSTEWYVNDAANCWHVVRTFSGQNAERRARAVAAAMNEREREWEAAG